MPSPMVVGLHLVHHGPSQTLKHSFFGRVSHHNPKFAIPNPFC